MKKFKNKTPIEVVNIVQRAAYKCMEQLGQDIADSIGESVRVSPPSFAVGGSDVTGKYIDITFRVEG